MAKKTIYQFYAELQDYEPKIWRRFQVVKDIRISRLAYTTMTMFEMKASHLYSVNDNFGKRVLADFVSRYPEKSSDEIKELTGINEEEVRRYQIINPEFDYLDDTHDASEAKTHQLGLKIGESIELDYDFGDGWGVKLVLEEIIEDEKTDRREFPRVLEGAGFGIVEDCGGPGGLEELAEAFAKKSGEMYEQLSAWLGVDDLDLVRFDIDDMNFRVKKVPLIYEYLYEYVQEDEDGNVDYYCPNKRQIDILERNYLKK